MNQQAEAPAVEPHYEFGKNWQDFIDHNFDRGRALTARNCLLQLLHRPDLKGQTFLDIGSGSGLHSLAAWMSGAEQITSFDYDADSVAATRRLHTLAGSPSNWTVSQGDVLDTEFLATIPAHDIVYSWGVLHHTGAMWKAIRNASQLVQSDGVLCIALYTTDVYTRPSPDYWIRLKRKYNRSGAWGRIVLEWMYALWFMIIPDLRQRRNPMTRFSEHKKLRGMSALTDVRDWLGGWPMEFAGIMETRQFCRDELGFELEWMLSGEGNTEYLFRRSAGRAPDETQILVHLASSPIEPTTGHGYVCTVSELEADGDFEQDSKRSPWVLFEGDSPLTVAHTPRGIIEALGGGRYSHWKDRLYFSTVDGSDPRTNGRQYSLRRRPPLQIPPPVQDLRVGSQVRAGD